MRAWIALALTACAGAPPASRTDEIVAALVDQDRALVDERPELVSGKWARMARDPQAFLRGAEPLFYRDLAAADAPRGAMVQIYGDLQLEHVGATFDGAGMLVDCTDYDASVRAPAGWEVRRAALGLAVAATLGGRDLDGTRGMAAEMAGAYRAPGPPLREGDPALGAILGDLLAAARERRDARAELAGATVIGAGGRRLVRDGVTWLDPAPPFDRGLDEAIAAYRGTRKGGRGDDRWFRVKDAARELGGGVASFANLRFAVLVEGASDADDDDVLLEWEEERAPPLGDGDARPNGERVFDAGRLLAAAPGVDPDLGFAAWQGVSFQVRRETAGRRALDVLDLGDDLLDGRYGDGDLRALARVVGRLLATAHARSGAAAAVDPFAVGDAAARDVERLFDDYALFVAALRERGPLLGAR